jgi:hypothetical protein
MAVSSQLATAPSPRAPGEAFSELWLNCDLAWGPRLDLRAAFVVGYEAPDADRATSVPDFWPAEGASVLDPNHYGQAFIWIRPTNIEECRRPVARRRVLRACDASNDGCNSPDHRGGLLPRHSATTRDRRLRNGGGCGNRRRRKNANRRPRRRQREEETPPERVILKPNHISHPSRAADKSQ